MDLLDRIIDLFARFCWLLTLFIPFIIFPLVWRIYRLKWWLRILLALVLSGLLVLCFYSITVLLVFRDGMGP